MAAAFLTDTQDVAGLQSVLQVPGWIQARIGIFGQGLKGYSGIVAVHQRCFGDLRKVLAEPGEGEGPGPGYGSEYQALNLKEVIIGFVLQYFGQGAALLAQGTSDCQLQGRFSKRSVLLTRTSLKQENNRKQTKNTGFDSVSKRNGLSSRPTDNRP